MKKYIAILVFIISQGILYSQNESIERLNIKSPEVSAFEKYGQIPVSTYTGIPNISVPIYKVKSGDLELPITLDYHATAIKVDQEATWVGLNWLLNAGGVIGSSIPKSNISAQQWEKLFDKMSYADTRSGDFAQTGQMIKYAGTHEQYSSSRYGKKIFSGQPESSSDNEITSASYREMIKNGLGGAKTFNANFMGYSFNFIYHPVQQKLIVTGQDNKFILQSTSGGGTEPYYTLTAPDGVKYSFSETETTTYMGGTPADITPFVLVSYYLTKVESPTGRIINLRYKKYGGTYPIIKATETVHSGFKGLWGANSPIDGVVERKLSPEHYTDNIYLYEIESDDALVRFNIGSRVDMRGSPKKLENIEVFDKLNGNKRIKRFVFGYDYYTGNGVGGDYIYDYYKYIYEGRTFDQSVLKFTNDHLTKRLRLISLLEEGYSEDGTKINSAPYKFAYNSSSLPGKTSAARDYWGNYNGKENAGGKYYHSLLPDVIHLGENTQTGFPIDFNTKLVKADQRLDQNTVGRGLLSMITYPTGGYNSFVFEPHKVSNYPYSLTASTETWTPTKSISTRETNFELSIPVDLLTPKEFILTQTATVTIKIDINKPASYEWSEMVNKPMYLMKYNTTKNSIYGNVTESYAPFKTYVLSDLTGLTSSVTSKTWSETVTLAPGKYRIQAGFILPQIGTSEATKGSKSMMITVSHPSMDLLSEYKFSTVHKYTRKTDTDFMLPEKELTVKDFIINEETGIECNVSIETNGKYSWSTMQGSTAFLYKYTATRNPDGSVKEQMVPVKQWGVDDLLSTSNETVRKKTELIVLQPGKYQMKTILSVPGFPSNTPEYINSSGGKILMNISKYTNTISGEINADAVGVRIAQIKAFDGTKERVIKYKYTDQGIPTGIMMNPLKFTRKKYQIYQSGTETSVSTPSGVNCSGPGQAQLINYWFYSSNNLIPEATNSIGYSYVEIIQEESGYETFTYWNKANYKKDYLKSLPDPRNGNLLENKICSGSNQVVKSIINKYSILRTESYFVNAIIEDIYSGGDSSGKCNPLTNPYAAACPYGRAFIQIYPSVKIWIEKTESIEEHTRTQGKVITQNIYTYNPLNLLPASKEEKINNNESMIQYYIYSSDYTAANTTYPGTLVSKNILNYPLEIVNTIKKSNGQFVLSGAINKYNDKGKIISVSNLENHGDLLIGNFKFSNKTVNGISTGNTGSYSPYSKYAERIICNYSTKGNPLYLSKDNTENTVYLWGYNNQYPIAEIQNASYTTVIQALGQALIDRVASAAIPAATDLNTINNLRNNTTTLKEALITTYTYKPLRGILTVTNPMGLITTFEYDAFGRLTLTRDHNGKALQRYDYNYKNQ